MPTSWKEMVQEAKKEVTLLQPNTVKEKLTKKESVILIDVREKDEYDEGHLPDSYHIPRGILEMTMEKNLREKEREIILYCAGGGRSALAGAVLKQLGYENVGSMEGGFGAWKLSGFEVQK